MMAMDIEWNHRRSLCSAVTRQVGIQDERGDPKQLLFAEATATVQVKNKVGVKKI
jgi:hypothetical protein